MGGYSVGGYGVRRYVAQLPISELGLGVLKANGCNMGGYSVGGFGNYSVEGHATPATDFGFGVQGTCSGRLQRGKLHCGGYTVVGYIRPATDSVSLE